MSQISPILRITTSALSIAASVLSSGSSAQSANNASGQVVPVSWKTTGTNQNYARVTQVVYPLNSPETAKKGECMTSCRRSLASVLLAQLMMIVSLAPARAVGRQSAGQSETPASERRHRALGMMSRVDFDRAIMLAQKIRMKEVSVFARLAICRDALL